MEKYYIYRQTNALYYTPSDKNQDLFLTFLSLKIKLAARAPSRHYKLTTTSKYAANDGF